MDSDVKIKKFPLYNVLRALFGRRMSESPAKTKRTTMVELSLQSWHIQVLNLETQWSSGKKSGMDGFWCENETFPIPRTLQGPSIPASIVFPGIRKILYISVSFFKVWLRFLTIALEHHQCQARIATSPPEKGLAFSRQLYLHVACLALQAKMNELYSF